MPILYEKIKTMKGRTEEMVRWQKVHVALAEDLSLIDKIYTRKVINCI